MNALAVDHPGEMPASGRVHREHEVAGAEALDRERAVVDRPVLVAGGILDRQTGHAGQHAAFDGFSVFQDQRQVAACQN